MNRFHTQRPDRPGRDIVARAERGVISLEIEYRGRRVFSAMFDEDVSEDMLFDQYVETVKSMAEMEGRFLFAEKKVHK